jgi:hypothetical protein
MAEWKFNVVSVCLTTASSIGGALTLIAGRGAGMEALSSLLPLVIFGGGGLALAFVLGLAAAFRKEQPYLLTLLSIALPPVAALLAPLLGR